MKDITIDKHNYYMEFDYGFYAKKYHYLTPYKVIHAESH